jgi:hypothetical protein
MNLITLTMNNIKQDDKTIREVQARVERWGNTPDHIREMFYKGMRKREAGMELVHKAKFELQQTGNWNVVLKNSSQKKKKPKGKL